jgi:uncharacterized membrane protein YphA (DoxX/SURF4 family)
MNKKRNIGYWAATGLLAAALALAGLADVTRSPDVVASLARLGYPAYVAVILGVWKALGAAAILAPRFPRLKEWAYAGVTFNLTGAVLSHLWSGDGPKEVTAPLVLLGLAAASWALRPEGRRLPSPHEPARFDALGAGRPPAPAAL